MVDVTDLACQYVVLLGILPHQLLTDAPPLPHSSVDMSHSRFPPLPGRVRRDRHRCAVSGIFHATSTRPASATTASVRKAAV